VSSPTVNAMPPEAELDDEGWLPSSNRLKYTWKMGEYHEDLIMS
jgi:hypothetical protein